MLMQRQETGSCLSEGEACSSLYKKSNGNQQLFLTQFPFSCSEVNIKFVIYAFCILWLTYIALCYVAGNSHRCSPFNGHSLDDNSWMNCV